MSLGDILNTDIGDVGLGVRGAVSWWLGEIEAMTAPLRAPGRRARPGVTAERRADGAYLIRREGRPDQVHAPGDPRISAALVLPKDEVLIRTIATPALPERDIRRMVRLDLDRLTPFAAEAVYHDIQISAAPEPGGRPSVRLAVVARLQADQAWEAAGAAGIEVIALLALASASPAPDFLPALRAARSREDGARRVGGRRAAYLWAAVGLLVVLNVGVAIWRDVRDVASLQAVVAAQQPVVDRIRTLRREVQAGQAQAAARERARAVGEPLRVLDALSRALPDQAWVQRLAWDGQAVRIAGLRQDGVDVAAALRREPLLANARADETGGSSTGVSAASSATAASSGEPFDVTAQVPAPATFAAGPR